MIGNNTQVRYWQRHFDQRADEYRGNHAQILDYRDQKIMDEIHDTVTEALTIPPNARILDVGCGFGDLAAKILSRANGAKPGIFTVDISEKILKIAKKHFRKAADCRRESPRFVCADLSCVAFRNNFFDIVIAIEVLQYTDPYRGISELMRITKKGGTILMCIPNKRDPIIKRAETRNRNTYRSVDIEHTAEWLNGIDEVHGIKIKPLVFAPDGEERIYREARFTNRLSAETAVTANRFVIEVCL